MDQDRAGTGISAVVITRNRKERAAETLDHFEELRRRGILAEIIVVDDGSSDRTSGMVEERYEAQLVRLLQNRGIPRARNEGARRASHELLLFLDDDGVLEPDGVNRLRALARCFREDETLAAVGLNVIDEPPSDPTNPTNPTNSTNAAPRLEPAYTFCGGAALMRKSAFLEAGMYRGDLFYSHEEDDLALRWLARGYRVARCPEVRFIHDRASLRSKRGRMRKIFYYYRNRPQVIWRHLPWRAALRDTAATLVGGAARTLFTGYFPAYAAGSLVAGLQLFRIIRKERGPLTPAQYEAYRKLNPGGMRLRPRLQALLADLRGKRGLDWI